MNMRSYSCCDATTDTSKNIQDLSGLLKIVAEKNRLHILCILRDGGEHCVCEFEEHVTDLSQSLISHHLADLKQAGLVIAEKRGLRIHYALSNQGRYVANIIFSLANIKEKEMEEKTTKPLDCCGSGVVSVVSGVADKNEANQCCESCNCKGKNCNRKECQDENRGCRNGMCNMSAAAQDSSNCCC